MEMITRSTRRSCHSVITTLPPNVLKQLNMEVGDYVEYVIVDNRVEIRKAKSEETEFLTMINSVMDDYNDALESLFTR